MIMHWPTRVWELGDVNPQGKQLWWSRPATPVDTKRRREVERQLTRRQDNE